MKKRPVMTRRLCFIMLAALIPALIGCLPAKGVPTKEPACQEGDWAQLEQPAGADHAPAAMRGANILFILVDDMDYDSLAYMPNVQKLLVEQGASFENYLVNVSLCCPSRATTLLGMYSHNSHILTNNQPNGGYAVFRRLGYEENNLPTYLQAGGYETVLLGKYLNGYPYRSWKKYIPTAWTEWYSPVQGDPYKSYGYGLNQNGEIVQYGQRPEAYMTDVLAGLSEDYLRRQAGRGQPFFVYLAPYAPHGPATPAPRHVTLFQDQIYPRTPAINEEDVSDKPAYIRDLRLLTESELAQVDDFYRNQLQSLQAVDEMVERLVSLLNETGQLENTFIFFTSDNGLHMGQHRLLVGKMSPYEADVRVPLVVRGPGIPAGLRIDALAGNVDLAATFLDIAGAAPPVALDGRSLLPLMSGLPKPPDWRGAYLLEHWVRIAPPDQSGLGSWLYTWPWSTESELLEPPALPDLADDDSFVVPEYRGLRGPDFTYVEYATGEAEFYDLQRDPFQLDNLVPQSDPGVMQGYSNWLACLSACSGANCRLFDRAVGAK